MRRVDYEFIAIGILSIIALTCDYLTLAYHIAFPFGTIFISFAYPFELVLIFLFSDLFYIAFGKKGVQVVFLIMSVSVIAELIIQIWMATNGSFTAPILFLIYVFITDSILMLVPPSIYYVVYLRRCVV